MNAANPWQQMKAIASRPGNMFRLVHPEELQQKIREKAAETFGAVPQGGRKKRKQVAQSRVAPALYVEPKALSLVEGSFSAADGQAMHQIKFEEVTADSHGLAFCTCAQAAPFLQGEVLSTDPLCLVTTNALPQDVKSDLEHMVVRYPVRYQPTGESMLLTGSLINLGDERVELSQGSIAEPTALSTGVCKVCAFRDELEVDWDSFCKGPVKWLINAVPALKVCSGVECGIDCPHFHPAIEEKIDQMIMDLWNRQFQTLDGKKADPAHAAVFSVLVRVPSSALDQLQLGHAEGIYVEPRSDTGVGTSEGYKVIWVPGIGKEKAKHIVRTQPKAITVARLGSKYGIRVRDQDEEALFNIVRPGFQFIKANVSRKYRVHPVPHGTQRSDMIRLLKEWGWVARPLQPARGDSAGASWLIGSGHEPPQGALATGNGFAIAMQVGGSSARVEGEAQVYASHRTKLQLQQAKQPAGRPGSRPLKTHSSRVCAAQQSNRLQLQFRTMLLRQRSKQRPDSRNWKPTWKSSGLRTLNLGNGCIRSVVRWPKHLRIFKKSRLRFPTRKPPSKTCHNNSKLKRNRRTCPFSNPSNSLSRRCKRALLNRCKCSSNLNWNSSKACSQKGSSLIID